MAGQRSGSGQRDSFSDLAGLMKAKKPYTPVSPPTPRPRLASTGDSEFFDFVLARMRLQLLDMPFASHATGGSSVPSPWPTSFPAPESVADFLERECNEFTVRVPKPTGYRESSMLHLESLFEQIKKHEINDNETNQQVRAPSPQFQAPLLIHELQSPIQFGPRDPPTPAESYRPPSSPFLSETEPVVRLTKDAYDSLGRDLDNLETDKRKQQDEISKLKRQLQNTRDEDHEVGTHLGLLKFQNEANRLQKADMGRALNEKEMRIKTQQLEIDELKVKLDEVEAELNAIGGIAGQRDYLRDSLSSLHDEHTRTLDQMTICKDQEAAIRTTMQKLKVDLEKMTSERDAALKARLSASDHATRTRNETLDKRERLITDLRHKHLEEQLKVTDLEDEVETLKARLNQDSIDDLKQKLREKTSTCDRHRTQLKLTEQYLKASQDRIMKVANNGEALRGAAHLVVPNASGNLPRNVVSCSECYANNLTCDASARCRSCKDQNTVCARWRCSLKHKLGQCPLAPCKLPHDLQGWLVLQQEARPQW